METLTKKQMRMLKMKKEVRGIIFLLEYPLNYNKGTP